MSGHTPGPWTINGNCIAGFRPDDSDQPLAIAEVYRPIHFGDRRDLDMMAANRRLLTSADAMLEILRQIHEHVWAGDNCPEVIKALAATGIAKATGEGP